MERDRFKQQSEYSHNPATIIEHVLPLDRDDAQALASELHEIDTQLTADILPQYVALVADGFADNAGVETVSMQAERSRGIITNFGLRFAKQGDSISYNIAADSPDNLHEVTIFNSKTSEIDAMRISPAAIIADLAKKHPELDILHELSFQAHHLSIDDFATRLMPEITRALNLRETKIADYIYEEQSYTHEISPKPYTSRTLQLRRTTTTPSRQPLLELSIETQLLAPETGEPIEDVTYGVHFATNTQKADEDTGPKATAFGYSVNPLYSKQDMQQIVGGALQSYDNSGDIRMLLADGARTLKSTQISELSVL